MRRELEIRFRLLGVLPLFFFAGQTVHYWRFGGLGNLLWMCNTGNLLLALGLFMGHRELIRAAAIWTIPGLGIWIWYVAKDANLSSTLAHVGGIIVGMIALRRVRMDRLAWIYALAWALLLQLAARWFTEPALNVNLAHKVQPGFERAFSRYWMFWLGLSVVVGIILWLLGKLFQWIWPVVTEPLAVASGSNMRD